MAINQSAFALPEDSRSIIIVGAEVDVEEVEEFEAANGREPNEAELTTLHRTWLENEMLYREGLALQAGNPACNPGEADRERIIAKARSAIDAAIELPSTNERRLRKWFDSHRAKYDQPARYDFQEAALSVAPSEDAVHAFVQTLNAGMPADAGAGVRVFHGRPHANLLQSYGPDFTEALAKSTPGKWQALRARDTWRAMRLDSITPSKPAKFETVRDVVLSDWKVAMTEAQRAAAMRALTKKYVVKFEPPAHFH